MSSNAILVVGTNVRNVAQSARKAGHSVYALTYYDDEDLKLYAEVEKLPEDKKALKERVEQIAESLGAKVVLSTGYEDLNIKDELVLGHPPREAARVKDKLKFYRTLERAGIPYPPLVDLNEADERLEIICKPRMGGGGEKAFIANTGSLDPLNSLESLELLDEDYICQRYVEGTVCSVSIMAGRDKTVVAVNEILVGWKAMNAEGFTYSGNITPLSHQLTEVEYKELVRTAIETVELFDLQGSVGVDFIVSDKPYVLEINPRFQASVDSIEWSRDVNMFRLHVDSLEGRRVETPKAKRFASRSILFADRTIEIDKCMTGNPFFADVPSKGVYRAGDPLISVLCSGNSRKDLVGKTVHRKHLFTQQQRI
ncbi:MAG: ATP-grasp domain-containing protein [Archaeoglobaceae archaeon]